ncbi:MAG: hypothetical protein HOL66_10490 [Rhodospirillaceae bacterium]|jgi:methionyl-tRNA formyltransferase|nr:hypothetical protein [Rhodospirillaceae bacterium]
MKVAALGRTGSLLHAAQLVAGRGHEIVVIWTCPAEPEYTADENDFSDLAKSLGAAFFCDLAINQQIDELSEFGCDIAISINWLTKLKPDLLSVFPGGVLNAHCGDLPLYRGNACPNWAIINDEQRVGLSIHQMAEAIDEGPVVSKEFLQLQDDTYIGDIYDWLEERVPVMLADAVDGFASGTLTATPQPDEHRQTLRTYPRRPDDARIDWNWNTQHIMRLIRASSHPFAGAFCTLEGNQRVTIWRAHPIEHPGPFMAVPGQICYRIANDPVVACGDGVLQLTNVTVEGIADAEDAKRLIHASLRNRLI